MPTMPASELKFLLKHFGFSNNPKGGGEQLVRQLSGFLDGATSELISTQLSPAMDPDGYAKQLLSKFKTQYPDVGAVAGAVAGPARAGRIPPASSGTQMPPFMRGIAAPKPSGPMYRGFPLVPEATGASAPKPFGPKTMPPGMGSAAAKTGVGAALSGIGAFMGSPLGLAISALAFGPTVIRDWLELIGQRDSDADRQAKLLKQERGSQLLGNAMIMADDSGRRREDRQADLENKALAAIMSGGQQNIIQQAMALEESMTPRGRAANTALSYELANRGDPAALMISAETPFTDAGFLR